MKPLPTGYRTATSDGYRIVIYREAEKIGEVSAPAGSSQAELVALEDEAADVAIAHASNAEADTEAAKRKRSEEE